MKKRNRAKSLGIVVAIVWLIALHAAVQPVVMGNTASDEQSTSLKGNIEGQFSCPMSIPASIETDLDIKFSLQGTITFTDPTGDVQTLITDELSGSSVSSEYSIAMDEVGAYTIAEELKLSIEAENALLSSYLESLAQEEEFNRNWEYENETAGEKTYTLSSRISDLDIQLSSEHLKALPKDEDTITITVEQTIPAEMLVGYIIEYSAQWTKESSMAADVDTEIQPNQPPVLDPIPDTEVIIGQDLEIVVSATDPDPGDTLTYSAAGEVTNMGAQLDDNVFTWQPMDDIQVGDYQVTFKVEDPAGGYDEKTAMISVISQEDVAPDGDGQPGDEPAGKGKGQEKPGKPDKKDDEPDGDDIDDQEPGKPEDTGNKPDAHVNLRLDDDSVKFRGGIPSFPAGDVEAVFELLKVLDFEGELNGIDYSLTTEITALYVEEDQMSGTLTLNLYLSSGDTEIAEPGLECTFELTRRKDNFRLDIEGEGLLFHDLAIKVIGVCEDGVVTAPVVHVDIKYGEEILEAVNVIPFEAVIQSFDLSDFPDEIVLPPGSFAGIEYSATLLLSDLRAKIVENRNKTQIIAGADVGVLLMINGIQVEDVLKSRSNLTVIRGKFRLGLRGNGSMLKINLNINADVADDGMIISPQVKLELIYRQEGLPRGDTSPEGEEPEVETPETIEEIAEDVKEAAEEATEAAQEAAEATSEQAAEAVKKAIKAAEKVAKEAEKALQKAEKAAEKAGKEKTEEAEQAAVDAEATAQEATFAALIAASNVAKAAERVAENTEKAAEAAKKAMEKGGLGARRAAEDALTAAENAAKQVAEAAQVVAANAQRAADNAAKAAEKAAKKAKETRDPQDQEAAQEAAEEAQEAAEEAAEIAQEAAEEAASAAAGAAENAALTAETDALEADEAAAEAAKKHAKEAQRLARKATSNARKAEEKAEKATEEAQLALEKAAEAADEASRLAAERAEEAAERAKEAAEKAYQAARRAGREATDLNDDGKNDIRDLMTVIAALGRRFASLDEEDAMKDINGDGIVDITDLVLTVQGLMGGMPIPATEEEGGVAAAPSTNANTNVRLEINQRKSDVSSNTIRVDLMADSIQDLYAFQFELLFDPDALEVAEVEEGDLLGSDGAETYWHSPGVDVSSSGKTISAVCTRIASEGVSEAGVLATVTFKAKGDSCRSANPLKAGRVKIADARSDAVEYGLELKGLDFAKVLMPHSPKLLQNYPNPFNPETWIPYELATDATVTIYIYNTSGQLVRQLDLGSQKAGSYVGRDEAACWDGRNEAGEQVASGVYFYHIQAGSFSATKKMAIVK